MIFGSDSNGSDVAALLGSLAGTAILYFSPSVNAAFDNAAQGDMPTSIVASRVSLNVFCVVAGVAAAVYLLLATFQGRYVVVAVVIIAAVVAAQKLADQVMGGNRDARQQLSLGTAGFVLLALVLGKFSVGLMIPLGLAMATIGCLWIPNDARSFFGDPPLGDQPTAP